MASVGLLYVGAVLILNGLMLLGLVDARAAAPLNFFVGGLQVITPTYLIVTADGDQNTILAASGLYLFGFTYLYVGFNLLADLDGTGLGWFSAFVACCAVVYAGLNFGRLDDAAFGVIWLYWAVLWALFWVVLGLKREEWTRFTGFVAVVAGVVTAAVPAFLLLTDVWSDHITAVGGRPRRPLHRLADAGPPDARSRSGRRDRTRPGTARGHRRAGPPRRRPGRTTGHDHHRREEVIAVRSPQDAVATALHRSGAAPQPRR
ncbi:AmiS/UreI family transporter [Blastococcus sp. TML/M2B]|uniref:AmiS/UreI family transporter n=1 Tax=Blastococcus sp. TML/M2B TaxID=2798727 RepID=UPI00190CD4D1|nr:AmiS/UreI family transporter [Blastococcus sp. TML/M2B]MBN1093351.1 AmiS/UreI family transporter [Blastococcus sp. TML/M2B]